MKRMFVSLVFMGWLLTLSQSLSAQDETVAGKMFYTELGGPGVIMSVNWDARFNPNTRLGLGYRIGVGFGIGSFDDKPVTDPYGYDYSYQFLRSYYSIPVGLNYVFGGPNTASTFEIGAGATFLTREVSLYNYEIDKPGHLIGFLSFMYRLTPVNSGLAFRVGFTPIIGTAGDLFPMLAISLGYAF